MFADANLFRLFSVGVALSLASCGTTTTAVTVPVSTLEVSPTTAIITVASSTQLTATPFGAGGDVLKGRTIEWSSSDPAVASVGASGVVTAVGGGVATITASSEGQSGTATITVPTPVASVVVSQPSAPVAPSETLQLSATLRDASGNVLTGRQVSWRSSDVAVATVGGTGLLTGVALGMATITATSEGISGTATVEVRPPVATVVLAPATSAIQIGDTIRLAATALDASGNPLMGRTVTWATSDGALATVDSSGLVTGLDTGGLPSADVTITATSEGRSGTATITVDVVADTITLGALVPGTIGAAGENDYYAFEASASDQVFVMLVETSGFVSSVPQMAVFAPSGAVLNGTSYNANTQQQLTLSETGTYLIRVKANTSVSTGGYALGLEGLTPVSPDSVTVATGDLLTGTIAGAGETDLYVFDGAANDRILVGLYKTSGFVSSLPQMAVYAPSGAALNNTSYNANSVQPFTLPETGKYVVRVRANTLVSTGGYSVALEGLDPLSPDSVTIALGDLITGTIAAPGEIDLYVFDGTASEQVFVNLVETSGFVSSVPQMAVYSPSGALLNNTPYNANSVQRFTLPETGKYAVRVLANTLVSTGGYSVGLEGLDPASPDSVSITPGDLITGDISAAGEIDLYVFDGTASDQVFVTLVETSGFVSSVPQMAVYAPSGAVLNNTSYNANTQRQFTLPETGKYVVRVLANTLVSTGGYAVGLEGLSPASPDAVPIAPGDLLPGSISAAGETDLYTFAGSTGDRVFVALVETSGFTSSLPQVAVFAPSGAVLDNTGYNANTQRQFTLPETGTYVVRVFANTLIHTGGYSVGLEGEAPVSPSASAIALGDLIAGSISAAGETDLYTFTGTATDRILVTLVETSGFAISAPQMSVWAPSGALLDNTGYNANTQRQFTLPETGTYVIRVVANTLIGTGGYSVGLEGVSPVTPGTPTLTLATPVSADIGLAGETDLYTFSATQGGSVDITLTETGGFSGSSPRGTLFAPSGAMVGTVFDGTVTRSFSSLPESGVYVIRVFSNTLVTTGTYDIEIQ